MATKSTIKLRKLNLAEELTERTRLEHNHFNSAVVASKMRVLQFEGEELVKSEAMLAGALESTRSRRKVVEATLAGLRKVLEAR